MRYRGLPGGIFVLASFLFIACNNCPASTCPTSFDVVQTCTSQHTCTVNSQLVTQCVSDKTSYGPPTGCNLVSLASGATFDIDVSQVWSSLGTRNDLEIGFGDPNANRDPRSSFPGHVLVDGTPATCTCGAYGCDCDNVPSSTHTIGIFNSSSAPIDSLNVAFVDRTCSPPLCEK